MKQTPAATATKIRFSTSELESKIRNLEGNGFEQYSSVITPDGEEHTILTNTIPGNAYNGVVVDIYACGGSFTIEYSRQ